MEKATVPIEKIEEDRNKAKEETMERMPDGTPVPKEKAVRKKRTSLRRRDAPLKGKSTSNKMRVNFSTLKSEKKIDLSDENTTNSENSEGNALFHDVDWEGNLENDAQIDEFAPRRRLHISQTKGLDRRPTDAQSTSVPTSCNQDSYTPGERVRFHNYDSSTWDEGVVEEIDELEHEVLVVSNGRKEWVNMTSQRISKISNDELLNLKSTDPSARNCDSSAMSLDSIIEQVRVAEGSSGKLSLDSVPKIFTKTSKPRGDSYRAQKSKKIDKMKRKKPSVKRKEGGLGSSRASSTQLLSKFKENEEVLAKWSIHRMQKFPAVIRKVLGQGEYDVQFHDGFVKTIAEESIYKATEEDCAKYQGANPSKADSFVEMDEDSKEARRQRKKKTFDDYFSAKDLERPKKKFPTEPGIRRLIKQKRSVGAKRLHTKIGITKRRRKLFPPSRHSEDGNEPDEEVFDESNEINVETEGNSENPSSPQVPPEQTLSNPPSELQSTNSTNVLIPPLEQVDEKIFIKLEPLSPKMLNSTNASSPGPSSTDQSAAIISIPNAKIKSEDKPENVEEVTDPDKSSIHLITSIAPSSEFGDRFTADIPEGIPPIIIKTKDGCLHKSVIVGDKNMLPNWSKHAVLIRGKYQVFLVSPEGWKLNSRLELIDYYLRTVQTPAPSGLDYLVDCSVIPALKEKQKELTIAPLRFPTWKIKRRKSKGKSGHCAGRFTKFNNPSKMRPKKVGNVRTLLPKYHYEPVAHEPPPVESENEHVWKCPKEGCDKKFRKESLLQMHIKHYHVELKSLFDSAPNVVDLALARSESNYSESLKPQLLPGKRPAAKASPHIGLNERNDDSPLHGSTSPQVSTPFPDTFPPRRFHIPPEERKSTIKTLLPTRPANPETSNSFAGDSEDPESDDDYLKIQKQRAKKMKYDNATVPRDIRMIDHGYPVSPSYKYTKKKQPAMEKLLITTDSNDSYTEEEKGSPIEITEDGVIIERLRSEEIINCTCGFREEDGLMIQCDICLCWQHGICSGIENDMDVPERYVCYICRHPYRVRSSNKYDYAVHYLTQGKLPSLSFRSKDEGLIRERENLLKRCFDLSSNLHQMGNVGRSLAVKLKIAEQRDHPKLYLWATNWRNLSKKKYSDDFKNAIGPEPEAPIDFEDCRERLVKDVETNVQMLDERLNLISNQISCLEAQGSGSGQSDVNVSSRTIKQTIQMLVRDLKDLENLSSFAPQS